jgi:hypothetical protein
MREQRIDEAVDVARKLTNQGVSHRYAAVLRAIDLGCFTNCLPALLPFALARLVAVFSDFDKDFQAASGRYRFLPFDGFPSDVLHFC